MKVRLSAKVSTRSLLYFNAKSSNEYFKIYTQFTILKHL